jgi:hypothetical protein
MTAFDLAGVNFDLPITAIFSLHWRIEGDWRIGLSAARGSV